MQESPSIFGRQRSSCSAVRIDLEASCSDVVDMDTPDSFMAGGQAWTVTNLLRSLILTYCLWWRSGSCMPLWSKFGSKLMPATQQRQTRCRSRPGSYVLHCRKPPLWRRSWHPPPPACRAMVEMSGSLVRVWAEDLH
jgi:hypothetical protein